jgi:hypothetical protein
MALRSCSSVNSSVSPNARRWSYSGDTMSGGGAVGLGKLRGSYFWYVWIMPPGVSTSFDSIAILGSSIRFEASLSPHTQTHVS